MATTTTQSSSIGLGGLLTVLFVGLKLTDNIDWSWWWVLSPLWIPAGILFIILAVVLFGWFVKEVFIK